MSFGLVPPRSPGSKRVRRNKSRWLLLPVSLPSNSSSMCTRKERKIDIQAPPTFVPTPYTTLLREESHVRSKKTTAACHLPPKPLQPEASATTLAHHLQEEGVKNHMRPLAAALPRLIGQAILFGARVLSKLDGRFWSLLLGPTLTLNCFSKENRLG